MLSTKTIGNKIVEARKRVNISQAQLAERMFISPQAVGKWERGESMPDITTFNRLAEILGVDLNYFSENFVSTVADVQGDKSDEVNIPIEKNSSDKSGKKLNWDMSRGNWVDADFSGLNNLHEKFSSSNMQRCKFIGSDLSGLLLKGNNVDGCDFSMSNITNSEVKNSHMVANKFTKCLLSGTEFSGSYLKGCDFSEVNFSDVKFEAGGFENNTVENAVWSRTSFVSMYLSDIVFDGKLDDCYFENCAFKKVTFQNATLINSFFKCRKLKGIQFVNCQADRMTYEFLKNGKADLTGITLIE